jgi:hypothetical protein
MELLVALAAFVIVDVLAIRFGTDSRPNTARTNDTVLIRNS